MYIRKLLCLALALALLLTTAACGCPAEETTQPPQTTAPGETELPLPEGDGQTTPPAEVIENPVNNPVTYFSLSLGEDYEHIRYLVAYENYGETYVEYVGAEKKVGTFGLSFLHRLTKQAENAGVASLDGRTEYAEGDALASMYITYADGTYLTADFSGTVPDAFREVYEAMDLWFAEQTAELPVYVPTPVITGDVDEALKTEILAILETSGIVELDLLSVSDIPLDDYFVFTAGLSSKEGILDAAQCTAMMMTTPYCFTVVTLREEKQIEAIREDFRDSLDWQKWVCVMPTEALIAQKGNMILCLMGSDAIYNLTVQGIEASGWTQIETFPNPYE